MDGLVTLECAHVEEAALAVVGLEVELLGRGESKLSPLCWRPKPGACVHCSTMGIRISGQGGKRPRKHDHLLVWCKCACTAPYTYRTDARWRSRTARGRGAWSVVTRRRRFTYSIQHILECAILDPRKRAPCARVQSAVPPRRWQVQPCARLVFIYPP